MIVFFNRRYCPGEAWTNRILAYARGFAEAGEDVVLYYIITDKNRTKPDISIERVKVINLWESDGFITRKFKIVSFLKNLLRFVGCVKSGDVLFLYGEYEYQLRIASRVKKKAKIFCEITEHPQIFGSSKYAQKARNRRLNLLKQLDGLFVISNSLKQFYIEKGIPKESIHVINMFVDTNRFDGLRKTTDEKYIAYCGAVSYEKDGANILIESFARFYSRHKDYKLYIIGKSVEPSVIVRLKKLVYELGIKDSVVFTGAIDPKEMPQLLYNARILALARPDNLQAQNGFPTKLGEYLATGNPVVATNVGEIPLFIKDKQNGFLAEPNPESFSEKLSWVADNYEEALSIGGKGRELAFSEFSYAKQSEIALSFMLE